MSITSVLFVHLSRNTQVNVRIMNNQCGQNCIWI